MIPTFKYAAAIAAALLMATFVACGSNADTDNQSPAVGQPATPTHTAVPTPTTDELPPIAATPTATPAARNTPTRPTAPTAAIPEPTPESHSVTPTIPSTPEPTATTEPIMPADVPDHYKQTFTTVQGDTIDLAEYYGKPSLLFIWPEHKDLDGYQTSDVVNFLNGLTEQHASCFNIITFSDGRSFLVNTWHEQHGLVPPPNFPIIVVDNIDDEVHATLLRSELRRGMPFLMDEQGILTTDPVQGNHIIAYEEGRMELQAELEAAYPCP